MSLISEKQEDERIVFLKSYFAFPCILMSREIPVIQKLNASKPLQFTVCPSAGLENDPASNKKNRADNIEYCGSYASCRRKLIACSVGHLHSIDSGVIIVAHARVACRKCSAFVIGHATGRSRIFERNTLLVCLIGNRHDHRVFFERISFRRISFSQLISSCRKRKYSLAVQRKHTFVIRNKAAHD